MQEGLDRIDQRLLNDWQRGFPLVARPFAVIAQSIETTEADVLERLQRLSDAGAVSRIGATCRPNTVGASTLAAMAVPDRRIEEIASLISSEPGVNHSYLRENRWNFWFVVTGPDRADVDASLSRLSDRSGLQVLDLRLVRPFNVDLGFALDGSATGQRTKDSVDQTAWQAGDRPIVQALSAGLPLVQSPFDHLASELRRTETDVLARIQTLSDAGILSRVGVIVRHRALGWRSNAMVVWDLPEDDIARAGAALVAVPGVTLCYQRRPVPGMWPYSLYCMVHARSHAQARQTLADAIDHSGLNGVPHQVLFSTRCFKQTGALIQKTAGATA